MNFGQVVRASVMWGQLSVIRSWQLMSLKDEHFENRIIIMDIFDKFLERSERITKTI